MRRTLGLFNNSQRTSVNWEKAETLPLAATICPRKSIHQLQLTTTAAARPPRSLSVLHLRDFFEYPIDGGYHCRFRGTLDFHFLDEFTDLAEYPFEPHVR